MNDESPIELRFFFISYTGDSTTMRGGIVGHLAFDYPNGFPSMTYICDVVVPKKCRNPISNVVITNLFEFKSQQDFDDFVSGHDLNNQINDILKQ